MRLLPVTLFLATLHHGGIVQVLGGETACSSNDDCQDDIEYCSQGICRESGTCGDLIDCLNPSNVYPVIECVGYLYCSDGGGCGIECSSGFCFPEEEEYECSDDPCTVDTCDETYETCGSSNCDGCNSYFFDAAGNVVCSFSDNTPTTAPSNKNKMLACFSRMSTCVEQTKGQILVKDLNVGDQVLTRSGKFQTVYTIDHQDSSKRADFLQIHYSSEGDWNRHGRQEDNNNDLMLEVTPLHMVFLHGEEDPIPAYHLNVGDAIEIKNIPTFTHDDNDDGSVSVGRIVKISNVSRYGVWNPITTDGTIVVDGVVTSTYSAVPLGDSIKEKVSSSYLTHVSLFGGIIQLGSHHSFLHTLMGPYRALCQVTSFFSDDQHEHYFNNGYNLYSTIGKNALEMFSTVGQDNHAFVILQDLVLFFAFASCRLFLFLFCTPSGIIAIITMTCYHRLHSKK